MNKIALFTTLTKLKKSDACANGLRVLIGSLPKNHKKSTSINLLHILKSNGLKHFFWAWRATTKQENKVKRLILHDIVAFVEPTYLKHYPDSTVIKDVLKALKSGNQKQLHRAIEVAWLATSEASSAMELAASEARSVTDTVVGITVLEKRATHLAIYVALSAASAAAWASSQTAETRLRTAILVAHIAVLLEDLATHPEPSVWLGWSKWSICSVPDPKNRVYLIDPSIQNEQIQIIKKYLK